MSKTGGYDRRIKKYAYQELTELYRDIGTSSEGLSYADIEKMREAYGVNAFIGQKQGTFLRCLRRAFINPFNSILFVLGIMSLLTDAALTSDFARNATTAIIIFSMILISGAVRFVQELKAKNAAEQLDRLIHERTSVRRAGTVLEILA